MSSLVEILTAAFQHQIYEVYTSIPCVIVNVKNIKEHRVDVQPVIKIITPNGDYVEHPVILSVPIMFPATKTSALTFKVENGDTVLCSFSQRCIDLFKASNGTGLVNPLDLRKFDKRDAVAHLGLFPFSSAINNPNIRTWAHDTNDTVLVHNIGTGNEVEIRLAESGKLTINTHQNVEVNCKEATVNATKTTVNGDMQVNGNINCSQTVTATVDVLGGGKSLATHTHMQTGHEAGTPTLPPT